MLLNQNLSQNLVWELTRKLSCEKVFKNLYIRNVTKSVGTNTRLDFTVKLAKTQKFCFLNEPWFVKIKCGNYCIL
ncbi:hypothetical protein LEP1GSC132_0779 [Leptospira kirschneri str. 200803703]|nr:hypothetical protein LEP1GSC132_0779 [Leptospira kirschneri str. 200803703]